MTRFELACYIVEHSSMLSASDVDRIIKTWSFDTIVEVAFRIKSAEYDSMLSRAP